ncbi:MAG: T9SS type A sorting domain-containing protein, partial [Bacteroidales bacterium]|nr:T9SS type A sorting domain-containing protein [Bacteroidales bacterium]
VAEGTYYPTCSLNGREDDVRAKSFKIGKSMFRIYGGFSGTERTIDERKQTDLDGNGSIEPWEFVHETILSGDIDGKPDVWTWNEKTKRWNVENNEGNVYIVVRIGDLGGNGLPSVFDGFSVTGGNDDYTGVCGGIFNVGYSGVVSRCKIFKNCGKIGGGIHTRAGVNACAIFNNRAEWYGGVKGETKSVDNCWIYSNSAILEGGGGTGGYFSGCRVYNNYARSGGGIVGGNVTRCTIYSNVADEKGGGVLASNLFGCRLYNNSAPKGGAVANEGVNLTIRNSIFYNNSSGVSDAVFVIGSTFANNGTLRTGSANSFSKSENNIFWNEGVLDLDISYCGYGGSTEPQYLEYGNILLEESPFVRSSSFYGVATTPEQLRELENSDWHLQSGSVCIDAGVFISENGFDIDSIARPQHTRVDMGAHEYVYTISDAVEMPYVEDFETFPLSVKFASGNWICAEYSQGSSVGLQYRYNPESYLNRWNFDSYVVTPYFLPEDTVTTLGYDLLLADTAAVNLYVSVRYMGDDGCDTVKIHSLTDKGEIDGSFTCVLPEKCRRLPFYLSFNTDYTRGSMKCVFDNIVVKGHNYHVGMADVEEKNIRIYPNPFVDVFYIDEEEGTRISVYDLGGTPVYEGLVTSTPHAVESSRWRPGSYLISLTGKDGQKSWKAVKK